MTQQAKPGWYSTVYMAGAHERPVDGRYVGYFGGYIWARSWRQAYALARKRGCYERVDGYVGTRKPYDPPSVLLMKRSRFNQAELFHATCFMGWLAARAGIVTGTEMLADDGLIHELAHHLHLGCKYMKKRHMRDALREIERAIPGYMPEGW